MRVFFLFSVLQYHLEGREVVRYFHEQGSDCDVFLGFSGRVAEEAGAYYAGLGIRCTKVNSDFRYEEAKGDDSKPPRPVSVGEIFSLIEGSTYDIGRLWFDIKRIAASVRLHRRVRREADDLLGRFKPDIVFLGSFLSCGKLDNAFARRASERGIPTHCLANTPVVGTRLSMEGRLTNILCGMVKTNHVFDHHNWLHMFIARTFPDWIHSVKGVPLMPFVDYELLAAKAAGIGEPWPWQKPSLHFDAFFVPGELSRELAVEAPSRFPAEKVHIVGTPRLDPVAAALESGELEKKVSARLGIELPCILLHVSPAYEHRTLSREDHFRNVEMLCRVARSAGRPVAIALHPLANPADYAGIFEDHGLAFDRSLDITELFPFASVVIAHPSCTNFLAMTFSKPLVVYDLQRELESESDWIVYACGTRFRGFDEESLRAAFAEACRHMAEVSETSPPPQASQRIYEVAKGFLSSRRHGAA